MRLESIQGKYSALCLVRQLLKLPSIQVVAHSGIIGTLFINTVHLSPTAAPFLESPRDICDVHSPVPHVPWLNLNLNDCMFLEIWVGSVVAALLVFARKINIFTGVRRVSTLFYKRSCFVCFSSPAGSCGDRNKMIVTLRCEQLRF